MVGALTHLVLSHRIKWQNLNRHGARGMLMLVTFVLKEIKEDTGNKQRKLKVILLVGEDLSTKGRISIGQKTTWQDGQTYSTSMDNQHAD